MSAKGRSLTKDALVEEYIKSHPKSAKLHERATKLFFASGATHGARVLDPFRPYITRAKGTRKWDVDGKEYIDYVMGHGALVLGHSHPAWVKAVGDQLAKGVHNGALLPYGSSDSFMVSSTRHKG
jgi:glutamate-1-semialdehyde 2,1-aminomutase